MKPSLSSTASSDVVIIGGGPAGLMAAIAAARRSLGVTVLERMKRPALKLLASGGGRCNLTNTLTPEQFMAALGRQGRFISTAMAVMSPAALREFLAELGVPTHEECCRVYPDSGTAATVLDALLQECARLGVNVRSGVEATALLTTDGCAAGVETTHGPIAAKAVIVAAGGAGYPPLGGTMAGLELARRSGHMIAEPVPALVGLIAAGNALAACAGVSFGGARVWIDQKGQSKSGVVGDVLLTHSGLSGPAVLDISGNVAMLLREQSTVLVRVNPCPADDAQAWIKRFDQWQHDCGSKAVSTTIAMHVPRAAAEVILKLAGVQQGQICAQLSLAQRQTLAQLLSGLPFEMKGTEGFDKAMVTRGGVSLKQVDPRTLQSRLVGGLFFAGEVLDLDGPSGGFNLQIAFCTGYLAGTSAADTIIDPTP